ncbi:hypothetical protein LTR05_004553 [Lithohypha guttulata]|uniref:Uncharacterized protein n=1 Tax=Lithohypha guttulata TaxID=1690604 RepID=A0AAN7SYZ2_9EURO|nr:hypothetical protein LTR05_004553 [Lithohypha guttulata]
MDTFRRLRSRKKDKEILDYPATRVSGSENDPSTNTWEPISPKASVAVPNYHYGATSRRESQDKTRLSRHPSEQKPYTSSGRMQPMLIGISRLPANVTRPDTGESLQKALDRAAESVSNQEPEQRTSSFNARLAPEKNPKSELSSTSAPPRKPTKTFDEDDSKQNDTKKSPIDRQRLRYDSGSKYQEEVANRNAHQIAAQRASSLRRPVDYERVMVNTQRSAFAQAEPYNHRSADADVSNRHVMDMTAHYSRQPSFRVREPSDPLPVILQEGSTEDVTHIDRGVELVKEAEKELERAKSKWLQARQQIQIQDGLTFDAPLPESPRHKGPLRDSGISYTTRSVPDAPDALFRNDSTRSRQNSFTPSVAGPEHLGSATLSGTVPHTHGGFANTPVSRHLNGNPTLDSPQRSDELRGPARVSKSTVYKKVTVGNRTIMDLTGDDNDEDVSISSYRQTPTIEDARANPFQRVIPTVIDHASTPEDRPEATIMPSSQQFKAREPVLDLDQLARRSQQLSQNAKFLAANSTLSNVNARVTPTLVPSNALSFSAIQTLTSTTPPEAITFSTINTMSSISPRSSKDILITRGDADAKSCPQPLKKDKADGTPQLGEQFIKHRLSANISPLVQIFADIRPEEVESSQQPGPARPVPARIDSGSGKSSKESRSSSKKAGKRREKAEEVEAIRIAAKSIIPAGPLDQEPIVGVKARDFAVLPLEKPVNKRVVALNERKVPNNEVRTPSQDRTGSRKSSSERKGRSVSKSASKVAFSEMPPSTVVTVVKSQKKSERQSKKKSSKQDSSTTRRTRNKPTFDEEAFQKKHAEANAALLRLQQSLQASLEDGALLPDTFRQPVTLGEGILPLHTTAPGISSDQSSPSAAVIAMITAATSRPGLNAKTGSEVMTRARDTRPGPPIRAATEGDPPSFLVATSKTTQKILANPHLARVDASHKPPPSPGEVSLSAFPIPTPRTRSPESTGPPAYQKDIGAPARRASQGSRTSSASAFSIPFTMVPNRIASLLENRVGLPGPPAPPQLESIDAMIPATGSVSVSSA